MVGHLFIPGGGGGRLMMTTVREAAGNAGSALECDRHELKLNEGAGRWGAFPAMAEPCIMHRAALG